MYPSITMKKTNLKSLVQLFDIMMPTSQLPSFTQDNSTNIEISIVVKDSPSLMSPSPVVAVVSVAKSPVPTCNGFSPN